MKKILILLLGNFMVLFCQGQRPANDYSAELARQIEPARKIVYKSIAGQDLQLHIFEPSGFKLSDRRACFVAIHGGGWSGGNARRFYAFAYELAKRGMVGISIEYRLFNASLGNTVFECVKDGRSAVRYIRGHAADFGIDPGKVIVCGGSAGGQIAAGTAFFDHVNEVSDNLDISARPDALVLYYSVLDTSEEGCGHHHQKFGDRWRELSPLHQVRSGAPPTIVFHGTGDTVASFAGAKAFQKAMTDAGNRCDLIVKEGGRHGYLIFDKGFYEEAIRQTVSFLRSLGYTIKD